MVSLKGTWRLVSLEHRKEDGEAVRVFGDTVVGLGTFTEDGYFFSSIMHANRPNFTSEDVLGGTSEEKVSAVETFVSYCGRCEVRDNKIIQYVEMSLFPNWVGGKQERFFEMEDDRLIIRSPPMLIRGEERTSGYSIWERVSD